MPVLFANPANWSQQYITGDPTDPHIPAGWIQQSTADGSIDYSTTQPGDGRPCMFFGLGAYSGGYPAYGRPEDDTSRPPFP